MPDVYELKHTKHRIILLFLFITPSLSLTCEHVKSGFRNASCCGSSGDTNVPLSEFLGSVSVSIYMSEFVTSSFFPNQWRIEDKTGCQWIIDSGYPDSQLCTSVNRVGDITVHGASNKPICKTIKATNANTCGILGSSFLNHHSIRGSKSTTTILAHSNDQQCFSVTSTSNSNNTEQTSARVQYKYGQKNMHGDCFIDTGGGVSMMSQSLAADLGINTSLWRSGLIQHTNRTGQVVKTPVSYTKNPGVSATVSDIDITPDRLVVVPDNLNTLYGYKCSIGEQYFANANSVTLDLPNSKVCIGF